MSDRGVAERTDGGGLHKARARISDVLIGFVDALLVDGVLYLGDEVLQRFCERHTRRAKLLAGLEEGLRGGLC